MNRKIERGIRYRVDFEPHKGYFWKVLEDDVVLSEGGPVPTERTAKDEVRSSYEDFGLQFPD